MTRKNNKKAPNVAIKGIVIQVGTKEVTLTMEEFQGLKKSFDAFCDSFPEVKDRNQYKLISNTLGWLSNSGTNSRQVFSYTTSMPHSREIFRVKSKEIGDKPQKEEGGE